MIFCLFLFFPFLKQYLAVELRMALASQSFHLSPQGWDYMSILLYPATLFTWQASPPPPVSSWEQGLVHLSGLCGQSRSDVLTVTVVNTVL